MLPNTLIHQRLRERRRVLLVVPKLAETNDIDNNIVAKLVAKIESQLGNKSYGFWVVAVNVKDRGFDHLDDVGAIQSAARVARIRGCKANLVVNNNMNRAAGTITTRLGHIKGFHYDTLTGKRRIAMT